jgi:hypothetical protein
MIKTKDFQPTPRLKSAFFIEFIAQERRKSFAGERRKIKENKRQ